MSARRLPERPNLDQLKRQAKELLTAWRGGASDDAPTPGTPLRLREAQRVLAQQYGFDSWDALRAHVESISGASSRSRRTRKEVLEYDDPVPGVVELNEPLTPDLLRRLTEQRASAVKIGPNVDAGSLAALAEISTLMGVELAWRGDLLDEHVAFLEAMPWLRALSLSRCGRITDRTIERLRQHTHLERINLQWTETGDAAIAALAGKPSLSRMLVGARMTDAGVARLRDFPALAAPGARDAFLAVSSARALTDDALAGIGLLNGVVALDLHMSAFGSPHYTARGVAHLKGMTSLEELNFHGALATDDVLVEIAAIPRLRWLHCQDPVSGDEGFVALGRCSTLESLASRVCRRMTDLGFAAIAHPRVCTALRWVVRESRMLRWRILRMRLRLRISARSCSVMRRSSTSRRCRVSSGSRTCTTARPATARRVFCTRTQPLSITAPSGRKSRTRACACSRAVHGWRKQRSPTATTSPTKACARWRRCLPFVAYRPDRACA